MTGVVLVGDLPGTGIVQASMAVRAAVHSRADYPAFIDLMEHGLRERSAVLVLCPMWRSAEAHKAVRLARGALDSDRIAFLPLDLPPLALSLVADQVAYVAPYVKPGVLASLADRLAGEVYAGAWVNSVAKLEHIETAFRLHVKSYLPGGFAVTAAPFQHVRQINSDRPVPEIARRPVDPVIMFVGHAEGDLDWIRGRLAPALAVTSLTIVGPQPLSTAFWGAKKYAEFVAFSGHPQAMQTAVAAGVYRPCGWCGEATALAQCPFCRMVQLEAVQPPRSSTQRSWPYPASPSEAIVQSSRSDEANKPAVNGAPSPLPQPSGTADPPPASEVAVPDPPEDRSDRNGAVSFRPARHR